MKQFTTVSLALFINISFVFCQTEFKEGDKIVSGGCARGGDRFAEVIAKKYGLTIIIHYPDWEGYPKTAGFIRNKKIAEDANVLIACVSEDRTGGAEHTIKLAKKYKKKIYIV